MTLFTDCFIQYQEPGVGEAFARLMRAAGAHVRVVDAGCCGRTALSTGQIDRARALAARCVERLHVEARAGRTIAVVEPSCLSMLHDDWRRLLPGDARVAEVAAASRFAQDVAADTLAEARDAGRLRLRAGGRALLHPHCHERALFSPAAGERLLALVPDLAVETLDCGCCGMSGVYGYEAEHYAMSVAIAERALLPAVRAAAPGTAVLATGTSCRTQLRDLAGAAPLHPLEFVADRLEA